MIRTIVTLACCALVAPLAFGQTRSAHNGDGAAASYQPAKTLVIRQDNAAKPVSYTIDARGHVVDKKGDPVIASVRPGTRVRVYYTNVGDQRMIDHVVVLD
jgi:hypothetical protein